MKVIIFYFALVGTMVTGYPARESIPAVPKPDYPSITAIEVQPAKLALEDGRDSRRVLVWGKTGDGQRIDLTSEAIFHTESAVVGIDPQNFISPREEGSAEVTVSALGKSALLATES